MIGAMIPQIIVAIVLTLMFVCAVARHETLDANLEVIDGRPVAIFAAVMAGLLWWEGFWS